MKDIDMSGCRIYFQGFLPDLSTGKYSIMLPPLYSEPIYDASKSLLRHCNHFKKT